MSIFGSFHEPNQFWCHVRNSSEIINIVPIGCMIVTVREVATTHDITNIVLDARIP